MKKYIVDKFDLELSHEYERVATVEEIGSDAKITVYFIEPHEYLGHGEKPQRKKKGDIIEGDISIDWITSSRKACGDLVHYQMEGSPHIEAVIVVYQVVDEFTLYAVSSLSDAPILVKFENVVNYDIGDSVWVGGNLMFNEIEP